LPARYPQPSSTVNTIGFVFLFIAGQNTRIRRGVVVKRFGESISDHATSRELTSAKVKVWKFEQLKSVTLYFILEGRRLRMFVQLHRCCDPLEA